MCLFRGDEPTDNSFEARPPKSPGAWARQQRAEMRAADCQQLRLRLGRQCARITMNKFVECGMDRDAEIGPAGVGIEFVEWLELEDMAGINRIGVAQPSLDLGHRELARARE